MTRLIQSPSTPARVAFSPDGGQVATVSADATVRFWDLTTGTALFTLRLPTNSGYPEPLWDFDFRCTGPDCWIAVPLTRGKLVLYHLTGIYGE
jgi:WD40 repeat protein